MKNKLNITKNTVAIKRNLINLPTASLRTNLVAEETVMSVVADIMQFGYMPTSLALDMLKNASHSDVVSFRNEVIDYLETMMGGKGNFRPFWKNFPQDVMDKSESELLWHMLINYWTHGAYEPTDFTKTRPTAYEKATYTYYDACDVNGFKSIFTNLVSANQSLTPQDLEDVKWFAENLEYLAMPESIPFKETLCTLASMGLDVPVKTPTDVLRIAVSMSGGDVSLPKVARNFKNGRTNPKREAFKFKKFNRAERRLLLRLLEKTSCDSTEAVLKKERWIKLGGVLHPGEFRKQYPKSFKMFMELRNEKVQSWYGEVNQAFDYSFEFGLEKLASRSGEFFRRIDALLRNNPAQQDLVLKFADRISENVSNKVLYEIYEHFGKRDNPTVSRSIMVKGARKKTPLPELPALSKDVISKVQDTVLNSISSKFKKLPSLGKVYIPEELKNLALPKNMRSVNPSLKPVSRGSLIPWDNPDAKVIRAFLHFKKDSTSMTIDLSAMCIGMGKNAICDWGRQKPLSGGINHSGDSFGRTGDCAEYVDLDVNKLLSQGFKYVLIQLNNYCKSPELVENNYFGVMERDEPKANKHWVPKTISNCAIVRVEDKVNCAVIDLENKTYVIVDEDISDSSYVNNMSANDINTVREYFQPPSFSVYHLLSMHANARGQQVFDKNEAELTIDAKPFMETYEEVLKWL
jgi:hypothetical protein